jgi:hypothetical protein
MADPIKPPGKRIRLPRTQSRKLNFTAPGVDEVMTDRRSIVKHLATLSLPVGTPEEMKGESAPEVSELPS